MLTMYMNSMKLSLKGELFHDNKAAFMQFKGLLIALVLLPAFGSFVHPLVGVIVASVAGGSILVDAGNNRVMLWRWSREVQA